MRLETKIAVLAFAGLAAVAAVALSFTAKATGPDTATALIRFERFEGALGSSLGAAEIAEDRQILPPLVAREVGIDQETVARSVRISTDSGTGVVAITATAPDTAGAKALADGYMDDLIKVSRRRLIGRAVEAQRYVRTLLSGRGQTDVSGARRQFLAQERQRLDDFLAVVRARRNPAIVQKPQARAAPTSRVALLSGLTAALGGLVLALLVTGLANRRRPRDAVGSGANPSGLAREDRDDGRAGARKPSGIADPSSG